MSKHLILSKPTGNIVRFVFDPHKSYPFLTVEVFDIEKGRSSRRVGKEEIIKLKNFLEENLKIE